MLIALLLILLVLLAIAGIGWLTQYIGVAAMLWYIQEKGCPLPSDAEMKAGTRYVTEHLIKDFFQGKRR